MKREVARLRGRFQEGRDSLFTPEARTAPGQALLEKYSDLVDDVVGEIYDVSCRLADEKSPRGDHSSLAIVATGGYGRRELNPLSDIDIAFIPAEEEDPWVEAAVHVAFQLVMDVFLSFRELSVGYAYRPVADAPIWDLSTRTALLDARLLCGDGSLLRSLSREVRRHLSPLDIVFEIQGLEEKRKRDGAAALYSVEPDLKNGEGALRDLHRGRWLRRLLGTPGSSSASPEDEDLPPEVREAAEWFWRARNWLHLETRKRSDILMLNYQDRIASELGGQSAQEWLSEHYGHAETLAQFRTASVCRVLEGPLDLGGVRLKGGYLHLEEAESGKGRHAVKMLQLSQRYAIPVGLADLQALEGVRQESRGIREPTADEAWAFLAILSEGRGVAETVRLLARCGLMDRFVENFTGVMRFVPPDPSHRYTVGDHSIRVVGHLEALRSERAGTGHRFAELLAECSQFDMLCLAALLHDAGKLLPGSDHSESGAKLAAETAARLALPAEKREILDILVRHHLLLVRTARLQDLKSPVVIQNVAKCFPSVEALRHLYVFTYVDALAVAEMNWTSMDYRDLEDLYRKVRSHLSGEASEMTGQKAVQERIGQIRRRLATSSHESETVREHCDAMPASYVLNTPLEEIDFHIQLLERLEAEKVVLDIYNRPGDDFSELTVCAYDDPQPGLLAKVTSVLYGCGANIHKAQVFTLRKERPVVLDTLWVRASGTQVSENRARRILSALRDILLGVRTVDQFLQGAGKQPPSGIVLDSLELRNDLSEEHTVVHVIARDLQGLLYLMTRAISRCGLHIHSAKVATWAGKAENNFYVTTLMGGQIPDSDLPDWKYHLSRMFRGLTNE